MAKTKLTIKYILLNSNIINRQYYNKLNTQFQKLVIEVGNKSNWGKAANEIEYGGTYK